MSLEQMRRQERLALCETLVEAGPDAPTLSSQWTSADIAAHLVVSEAYRGWPLVLFYGLRRVMPPRVTQRGVRSMQRIGNPMIRRARSRGWPRLLSLVAAGPPPAYFRPGGIASLRFVEEWVHHEDIRRTNGGTARAQAPAFNDALWDAAMALTSFPDFLPGRDGIQVALPDGRSHCLGDAPKVRIEGEPGEVLLYLAGRTAASEAIVSGDASAVEALNLTV